jgi:O-antigen ligase
MHSSGSNLLRLDFWKELISFRSLVVVSPVFLLTVKHWTNLVVLIVFIGSLFFLLRKKEASLQDANELKRWRWIFALTLTGPVFAVGMGQLLRGEFYPPNFDAPLRIALCAPIFLAISHGWLTREGKDPITFLWVKYTFPGMLLWTFIDRPSWSTNWGENRITTYFVDPLTFGSLTLLFSLLSVASLNFFWQKLSVIHRIVVPIAVLSGLYLSFISGSRTGWLALPLFLFIWMRYFAVQQYGKAKAILVALLFIGGILLLIPLQPVLVEKIHLTLLEVSNYHWNTLNPDTSVSMRISFYRMAIFYFFENPFKGWGDLGWMELINSPEISQYATAFTKDFAKNGFHNEVFTNAVKSGIWGLISSIALLFTPVVFAINILSQSTTCTLKFSTLFLLIFMTHMIVAGMTTEVTNLVFLASFIGLSLSIFIGDTLIYAERKLVSCSLRFGSILPDPAPI